MPPTLPLAARFSGLSRSGGKGMHRHLLRGKALAQRRPGVSSYQPAAMITVPSPGTSGNDMGILGALGREPQSSRPTREARAPYRNAQIAAVPAAYPQIPRRNQRPLASTLPSYKVMGTCLAIAHMNPASSRAMAVTTRLAFLPRSTSFWNRLHSRT